MLMSLRIRLTWRSFKRFQGFYAISGLKDFADGDIGLAQDSLENLPDGGGVIYDQYINRHLRVLVPFLLLLSDGRGK